jgi:hypothetical protein
MTFKVGDQVQYTVPVLNGWVVGRAVIKRILEPNVADERKFPIYHIKCHGGGYKYVDVDDLIHIVETPENYELVAATEI